MIRRKTWERTERMPKMVASGTRIGIRPSLFSSGCLWFVSWHPHCSVEWCYNILTISRSGNVNSPLGYLYKITYCISSGGWSKDQHIIKFHCWPTSHAFPSPTFSFGSIFLLHAQQSHLFWNVESVTRALTQDIVLHLHLIWFWEKFIHFEIIFGIKFVRLLHHWAVFS